MSRYGDLIRAQDTIAAAQLWARAAGRLRDRGLSAEQVAAVLAVAERAVSDTVQRAGEHATRTELGQIEYVDLAAAAAEDDTAGDTAGDTADDTDADTAAPLAAGQLSVLDDGWVDQ